ncbi:hypothetical protein [Tenacibaculum discolor]|uniref:Uncharacterized protein n=1 Tax=Tenacibaculum discolor TaxID=361581 RepID=A0ABT9F7N5_9FLAO|nr:hypothetical protein [Tenacibaculum discolor]MDP2542730.1 hypothetical protein [Tenacibaculum discolor]
MPNATQERIRVVLDKIKAIEDGILKKINVDTLIIDFNKFTGRNYDLQYFSNFRKYESIEKFSNDSAQRSSKNIENITEYELIEIVERIRNNDLNEHFYMEIIDNNINCNQASDFIYFPENYGLTSTKEIASFILMYHNRGNV